MIKKQEMDFYLVTGNDCKSSETQLKPSFKNEKTAVSGLA